MARGPRADPGACAATALEPPVGTSRNLVHDGDAVLPGVNQDDVTEDDVRISRPLFVVATDGTDRKRVDREGSVHLSCLVHGGARPSAGPPGNGAFDLLGDRLRSPAAYMRP